MLLASVVFGLPAPSALAHTNTTFGSSIYFSGVGLFNNFTIQDGGVRKYGSGWEWDFRYSAQCADMSTSAGRPYMQLRWLNSAGDPTTKWLNNNPAISGTSSCHTATDAVVHKSNTSNTSHAHFQVRIIPESLRFDPNGAGPPSGEANQDASITITTFGTVEPTDVPAGCPATFGLTDGGVRNGHGWAQLTWTQGTPTGSSFAVERRRGTTGEWSERYRGSSLSFEDSVGVDVLYTYRIQAFKPAGGSGWCGQFSFRGGDDSAGNNTGAGGLHGGDADEDGASCGFNVFCWIKAALVWAFVPSDGARNAWRGFWDNMRTKPPFGVAWGLGSYVVDIVQYLVFHFDVYTSQGVASGMCITLRLDGTPIDDTPACLGEPMAALAQHSLVAVVRFTVEVFLYAAAIFALWRIFRGAFSDAPTERTGDITDQESGSGRDDE